MRACAWLLVILPIAALADTKIVSKETVNGYTAVATIYRRGHNLRWENGNSATIVNMDERRAYTLDLRNRTWTPQQPDSDPLFALAMWIRRPPRVHESGKTVNVWYQTTDTGEHRQMLGHTVHHFIYHERQTAEPGACATNVDRTTDGWYILNTPAVFYDGFTLTASHSCQDKVIVHGTRPATGIALLETVTDGAVHRTREVTEYSDRPLDPHLFEPPGDFRRVEPDETWAQRMKSDCLEMKRALQSWFN
jgi:hypothetical protein